MDTRSSEPRENDDLAGIDTTRPSVARLYDYFLNGEHYFEVDRVVGEMLRRRAPEVHEVANSNRIFVRRSVRWMARMGVTQFLDIGSGLPTQQNTHEVAHEVNPEATVVYVDHDPTVEAHAAMLLGGTDRATFVTGDFTDPPSILEHPGTRALIDFEKPVGLVLAAIVHFVPPHIDLPALLWTYLDALAPDSYLAMSHITDEGQAPESVQSILNATRDTADRPTFRNRDQVRTLFDGLELVPAHPGGPADVVWCNAWGAANPDSADRSGSWLWAGVGRKP